MRYVHKMFFYRKDVHKMLKCGVPNKSIKK